MDFEEVVTGQLTTLKILNHTTLIVSEELQKKFN